MRHYLCSPLGGPLGNQTYPWASLKPPKEAGLLRGISQGQSPREIPRVSLSTLGTALREIVPEVRITPVNSGYYTLQIYPRAYVNMFRVKPRATLGLTLFTVLIQNSDKQWNVLCGCLEKVALGNSLGSSDFPSGLRPSKKSDDPREFPRATFSRQSLRTFHCLYQSGGRTALVSTTVKGLFHTG